MAHHLFLSKPSIMLLLIMNIVGGALFRDWHGIRTDWNWD